ncbi:SGNH/GDSL hydrolase family protein [Flavobacterium sp. XS2P14]|uniref:SGNH/GDSL hydrolase family protein n=1 Tax=Flavobacterium sp. XS2P14 TaxID=3401735 RepID=UPI003AAD05D1
MADKNTIKNWFKTGLKPTQAQFWATWDSFWHKDEKIPITAIDDIENILADKADAEVLAHHMTDLTAHADLFLVKEDKSKRGAALGYAPLNEFTKLAIDYLNVVNDLVTGGSTSLLTAEQGKLLQIQITAINTLLTSDNVNLDNVQEIVDAIENVQTSLSTILVNDLTTGGTTKALTAEMGKSLRILVESKAPIVSTIKEEFVFLSSQFFQLANPVSNIFVVFVNGLALSSTQYQINTGNILQILPVLEVGNKVIISYNYVQSDISNYTKEEVDRKIITSFRKSVDLSTTKPTLAGFYLPTESGVYNGWLDKNGLAIIVDLNDGQVTIGLDANGVFSVQKTTIDLNLYAKKELAFADNLVTYGFNGTDANYTKGSTRIQGQKILGPVNIDTLKVFGLGVGVFKILELTRNLDLTFNFKQLIFEGYMGTGLNTYNILNKTIEKDSYLAFYSPDSGGAEISFTTGGTAFSTAGIEITGNNFLVTNSGINLNFSVTGKAQGITTLRTNIKELYDKKTIVFGNELAGVNNSDLNTMQIISDQLNGTTHSGKIKKINALVKTAGNLTIFAFKKLANGNFDFVKLLGEFPVSIGVNNIVTDVFIEKGSYIGFFSDAAVLGWQDWGHSYKFVGYRTGTEIAASVTTAKYALNVEIEIEGVLNSNKEIKLLQNNNLDGTVFKIGRTIPNTFFNNGWVNNSSPTVDNSLMYFNTPTGFDSWIGRAEIKLLGATNTAKIVMLQGSTNGIYVTFDFALLKIQIHSAWDGVNTNIPTVLTEGSINIPLTQNKTYICEVKVHDVQKLSATIYNKSSGANFSIFHLTTGDSVNHGSGAKALGLLHKSGTYERNALSMVTTQKTNPKLMVYGDSYVVGYNLLRYGQDFTKRWVNLVKNELANDICISATGGESSNGLLLKTIDFQTVKSKYTFMFIGLNDALMGTATFDQFKQRMTLLINIVRRSGSTPILCTYPRLGNSLIDQMNSWIRGYTGLDYVDFQLATSIDGTSDGVVDPSLFLEDGHPNELGCQRYFEKIKLDVPYVFY